MTWILELHCSVSVSRNSNQHRKGPLGAINTNPPSIRPRLGLAKLRALRLYIYRRAMPDSHKVPRFEGILPERLEGPFFREA